MRRRVADPHGTENDREVAFMPVFRAIDNCRKFREGDVPKSNGRMN